MEIPNQYIKRLFGVVFTLLIILCLFFGAKFLSEFRSYNMMGSNGANTITLTGHGEVQAVPDIASVYFTIESTSDSQLNASSSVNTKSQQVINALKEWNIDDKDIKTENYTSYPKYSNPTPCPMYYSQSGAISPCSNRESKIVGYTVSESITAKIRLVDNASKIIDAINKIGVSNMSGPNFTVDDPDTLTREARKEAIDDARTKADALAKDLGVRIVRVSSYTEGGYGGPMYYAKDAMMESAGGAPAPATLPKGENTISSDVTITYEIR